MKLGFCDHVRKVPWCRWEGGRGCLSVEGQDEGVSGER